jgi:hypothetical protein
MRGGRAIPGAAGSTGVRRAEASYTYRVIFDPRVLNPRR